METRSRRDNEGTDFSDTAASTASSSHSSREVRLPIVQEIEESFLEQASPFYDGYRPPPSPLSGDNLRSTDAIHPLFLQFYNDTDRFVDVIWVDYVGQWVRYETLAPHNTFDIYSYVSHPWVFLDAETGVRLVVSGRGEVFVANFDDIREQVDASGNTVLLPSRVNISIPIMTLRDRCLEIVGQALESQLAATQLGLPKELVSELLRAMDGLANYHIVESYLYPQMESSEFFEFLPFHDEEDDSQESSGEDHIPISPNHHHHHHLHHHHHHYRHRFRRTDADDDELEEEDDNDGDDSMGDEMTTAPMVSSLPQIEEPDSQEELVAHEETVRRVMDEAVQTASELVSPVEERQQEEDRVREVIHRPYRHSREGLAQANVTEVVVNFGPNDFVFESGDGALSPTPPPHPELLPQPQENQDPATSVTS